MQWRFMIAALGLVLSACLHSATAYIAPHDLVAPTGLGGRYWAIGHDDERINAEIMAFARGADGLVIAQGLTDGADEEVPLRFVRIAAPDLYLLIDDSDKDTSTYYLFRKRENGIWDLFEPSLNKLSPFVAEQAAFLNSVAKRHGLSLDIGGDGSAITGPVTKGTIPALFRDPDFLAAIDTELFATYLPLNANPAPSPARPPNEIATVTTSMMAFAGTFTDWSGIVQPRGLDAAGYLDQYDGAGLADGVTRFRLRADGRYDILEHGLAPRPVAFLPLEPDAWLAIEEHTSTYEGKQDIRYLFRIMTRMPKGLAWQTLWLGSRTAIPEIARERDRAMGAAAARHGMTLDTYLSGTVTPRAFVALLRDGQFTIGLSREQSGSRTLYPEVSILERFTATAAPAN